MHDIVEERNSRAGSGGLSPERGGILGSVIWTLDLSTSMKYILCYIINLSGNLVSSEQLYLIGASGYRYNIHQERIDRGVLCTGEPEERLHGCGGVLVVRSRMGSTTMVLVTLSALTTATIE